MRRLKPSRVFLFLSVTAVFFLVCSPAVFAQTSLDLPQPGEMITRSPGYSPARIVGMTINPTNPLEFDFIVDKGDSGLEGEALEKETQKLAQYFLAALTIPDEQMWVNLSPYERDLMITNALGATELGKDMLSQDYILKQLTATLTYPENELGEVFWSRVYAKAKELYGTTEIPINTFNKVWVLPEKAVVYEEDDTVFVADSYLKVMLDRDYVAMKKNLGSAQFGTDQVNTAQAEDINNFSSDVVKETIIPEIEREVNEGKHFGHLRQIYNSVILATWYKKALKESLLGKIYIDKAKVAGVDVDDKNVKEQIYEQYMSAFRTGVYKLIKEDYDFENKVTIEREYFSGGLQMEVKDLQQKKGPSEFRQLPARAQQNLKDVAYVARQGGGRIARVKIKLQERAEAQSENTLGLKAVSIASRERISQALTENGQAPQANVVDALMAMKREDPSEVFENLERFEARLAERVGPDAAKRVTREQSMQRLAQLVVPVLPESKRQEAAALKGFQVASPRAVREWMGPQAKDNVVAAVADIQANEPLAFRDVRTFESSLAARVGEQAAREVTRPEIFARVSAAVVPAAPTARDAGQSAGLRMLAVGSERSISQFNGPDVQADVARAVVRLQSEDPTAFTDVDRFQAGLESRGVSPAEVAKITRPENLTRLGQGLSPRTTAGQDANTASGLRVMAVGSERAMTDAGVRPQVTRVIAELQESEPTAFTDIQRFTSALQARGIDADAVRETTRPETLARLATAAQPRTTAQDVGQIAGLRMLAVGSENSLTEALGPRARTIVPAVADMQANDRSAFSDLDRFKTALRSRGVGAADVAELTKPESLARLGQAITPQISAGADVREMASLRMLAVASPEQLTTAMTVPGRSVNPAVVDAVVDMQTNDPDAFADVGRFEAGLQRRVGADTAREISRDPVVMGQLASAVTPRGFDLTRNNRPDQTGGIDFNVSVFNLQIKRNGTGVPLPVSLQDLENINIDGLYPVVMDVSPATEESLPALSTIAGSPLLNEPQVTRQ